MAATGGGIGMFARMKKQGILSHNNSDSSTKSLESRPPSLDGPVAPEFENNYSSNFSFQPSSKESDTFGGFGNYDDSSSYQNMNLDNESTIANAPNDAPKLGIAMFAQRRDAPQQRSTSVASNTESNPTNPQMNSMNELEPYRNPLLPMKDAGQIASNASKSNVPDDSLQHRMALFGQRRYASSSLSNNSESSDTPRLIENNEPDISRRLNESGEPNTAKQVSPSESNKSNRGIEFFSRRRDAAQQSSTSHVSKGSTQECVSQSNANSEPKQYQTSNLSMEGAMQFSCNSASIAQYDMPMRGIALFAQMREGMNQSSASLSSNADPNCEHTFPSNSKNKRQPLLSTEGTGHLVLDKQTDMPSKSNFGAASTPASKPTEKLARVTPDVSFISIPNQQEPTGQDAMDLAGEQRLWSLSNQGAPSQRSGFAEFETRVNQTAQKSSEELNSSTNQRHPGNPPFGAAEASSVSFINDAGLPSRRLSTTFASTLSTTDGSSAPAEPETTSGNRTNPMSSHDPTVADSRTDYHSLSATDGEHGFHGGDTDMLLYVDDSFEALYGDFTLMCREVHEKQNQGQNQLLDMEVQFEKGYSETLQYQANFLDLLDYADDLDSDMADMLLVYQHEFGIKGE